MVTPPIASSDRIRVEGPPDNPQVYLGTADGRWIALHSPRNAAGEAAAWLERSLPAGSPPSVTVVIGAGAGHVLETLSTRLPGCPVIVLEPEPALSEVCRRRHDLSGGLASGHLQYLTGPDYLGAAELWRTFDRHPGEVLTLEHPVFVREYPDDVDRARAIVKRARFDANANAEARRLFAGPYLLNTLHNLSTIVGSGDVRTLAGLARGHAALLVAAGPSLDRTIHEVRRLRDRAVVIAVDTALKPLLGAGVEPDLVVAVDPAELNARHLRDLPREAASWFVAEGSLHPSAYPAFAGRTFTFKVSAHDPWPWLRQHGLDRGTLRAWGSVLTSTFDLALLLGCDPLVFVGADLAYTDGRPYCRGTTYEHDWAAAVAAGASLPMLWSASLQAKQVLDVDDMNGRATHTGPHLVAFRDWLVEQAAVCGRRVINATSGGILTGRTLESLPLDRALAECPRVEPPMLHERLVQAHLEGCRAGAGPTERLRRIGADPNAVAQAMAMWKGILDPEQVAGLQRTLAPELLDLLPSGVTNVRTRVDRAETAVEVIPHPPEQAALLHGARHGVPSPAWVSRSLDARATGRWLRRASGHLERLLHAVHDQAAAGPADLTDTLRAFDASLAAALHAAPEPAAWPVEWPPRLRPVLDDTLNDGLPLDGSLDDVFAEAETRLRLWLRASRAILGDRLGVAEDGSESVDSSRDLTIRVPRRVDTLLGLGCGAVAESAIAADRAFQTDGGVLAVDGSRPGPALAEVCHWRNRAPTMTVPVRILQREGLSPVSFVTTLDDRSALLTSRTDRCTYRLDEAGRWGDREEWPTVIDATVGLPGGGRLGWNVGERRALLRTSDLHDITEDRLPFDTARVLIEADGTALWPARTGGCWSWLPGAQPRLVADVPAVQDVEREGADLVFSPALLTETGVPRRVVLHRGWRWCAETGRLEPLELGTEGACSSQTRRGSAQARVYNTANLVRIVAGRSWDLLVPEPLVAAWAGPSLAVAIRGGEVLFFERLLDRLQEIHEGSERV